MFPHQRRTFLPPRRPKIKNFFTAFSLDCVNRCMIKMFSLHIDWTLTVAMVTGNGRKGMLK